MSNQMYNDGYRIGTERQLDPIILRRAIGDSEEMGWTRLCSYFQGQLDATLAKTKGK